MPIPPCKPPTAPTLPTCLTRATASSDSLVNANSPGWPAAQIQTIFTGSTNLDASPAGTNTLEDNLGDLEPRAHVYLSCGATSLPVQFTLDTGQNALPTDFMTWTAGGAMRHQRVRTQTRVEQTFQFRNTALSALLHRRLAPDTNGNSQLRHCRKRHKYRADRAFQHGRIGCGGYEPGGGGTCGVVGYVGPGPASVSYAVVTDANGDGYQTPTVWEQLPALQLSLVGPLQTLRWPAIAGRQAYNAVLAGDQISAAYFKPSARSSPPTRQARWPIPTPARWARLLPSVGDSIGPNTSKRNSTATGCQLTRGTGKDLTCADALRYRI